MWASPMPVLPAVPSTTVPPGLISPVGRYMCTSHSYMYSQVHSWLQQATEHILTHNMCKQQVTRILNIVTVLEWYVHVHVHALEAKV